MSPEPLPPGHHLAWVDCVDCGRYVLAMPTHPDPRCTKCGREFHGVTDPGSSRPAHSQKQS